MFYISVVSCFMTHSTVCVFKPSGKGKRLPEVHCIVSKLGCFNLFAKVRKYTIDCSLVSADRSLYGEMKGAGFAKVHC